jgi:8-oxo-dGTP diphosphatase
MPKIDFPIGLKRAAAMVVLRHKDQFLLLKRAKPPFVGHYLPVGGKLEPYEDPYSAAVRELREETGIGVEKLQYGGVLIETSPIDYNWQSNIYLADIPWRTPPECPEGQLEWVSFAQLANVPTPPTDGQIYQYLAAQRPFAFNAVYDEALNLLYMVEEIQGIQVI